MSDLETCPVCGATAEEFRRTGLLGCPECYRAFRGEVLAIVGRTQRLSGHVGKIPNVKEGKYAFILEQQLLKDNIERAMREGRYAEAEKLKKRLLESNRILWEEENR